MAMPQPTEKAKTKWPRVFGIADGVIIGSLLFSIIVVPIAVRAQEGRRFSTSEDKIAAEREKSPLTKPAWEPGARTPFGNADMPGKVRIVSLDIGDRKTVKAAAVGGHGQGVVVMEVPTTASDTKGSIVDRESRLVQAAGEEMDQNLASARMLRSTSDPTFVAELQSTDPNQEDQYVIDDDYIDDYTRVSTRVVQDGDRKVLVVSFWPGFEKDPLADRISKSAVLR